mmetsp:Transcript_6547/g.18259  ORF Transcript_6547/g.18259 Transcript_6547/m.18259 type:complete len:208 (+) Transcript_6547:2602-3225(+)
MAANSLHWGGRLPVMLEFCTRKDWRDLIVVHSLGSVPDKQPGGRASTVSFATSNLQLVVDASRMLSMLRMADHSLGRGPLRAEESTFKVCKADITLHDVGRVPVTWAWPEPMLSLSLTRMMDWSWESVLHSEGRDPEMVVVEPLNSMAVKSVSTEYSGGSMPSTRCSRVTICWRVGIPANSAVSLSWMLSTPLAPSCPGGWNTISVT